MVDRATAMAADKANPWPSMQTARSFLQGLVSNEFGPSQVFSELDPDDLATWLVREGLASLAYRRYKESWPELAERLRPDYYITAMGNSLHMARLARIAFLFSENNIPFVLLKGAALSHWLYGADIRPMSDLDLWIPNEKMAAAVQLMLDEGYRLVGKRARPPQLQQLSEGELTLVSSDGGLVELHWSPYAGWWLHRTARVDVEVLWKRIERLVLTFDEKLVGVESTTPATEPLCYVLDVEDTILHLAVHLAVNHQFGMWCIRGIVDIALVAQEGVDWELLVQRAKAWRLETVLSSVLELEQQLIGESRLGSALKALQRPSWKRAILRQFISPESLLASADLRQSAARFGLLLLLTDRTRDAAHLVLRTLCPERTWLQARYGEDGASYGRHLWNVLRHGAI